MPKLSKFKLVLVGDQNVGKTSIISRFIHDTFQFTANPTVGIDFITKTMQIEGETLRLQLWDTAGQERFRALIPSYVKDADTCLIVVDLSVKSTFDNLDKWLDFVRESRGPDASIYIVGNKADISEREVMKKDIEEYSEKHQYPYLQVSAKTGNNIHNLFRKISERLIEGKLGKDQDKSQEVKKQLKKQTVELKKKDEVSSNKCQC